METHARVGAVHNKQLTKIKEEQTSSDESQTKTEAKRRRHRASVACTSCRDRRIRCVVPTGKKACLQCERSSALCMIKDDDERRRPISRAYVHSLVERIALLEGLLQDQDMPIPPADHPPETRLSSHPSRRKSSSSSTIHSSATSVNISSSSSEPASSPCSSTLKDMDDYCSPNKRRLDPHSISNDYGRASKKPRNDSLVFPTDLKVEPPIDDTANFNVVSNELTTFATMPSYAKTFFWPTIDAYTGGGSTLEPKIQSRTGDCSVYSTWSYNANGLTSHLTDVISQEATHLKSGHDAMNTLREGHINLDFMPFDRDDWSS
ncbi:hypothetical protein EKO04_011467 [Ascochyta lentis]|uniref:Zn(2)-C6 fungal-type domain-containing protein n=1 Tax=Ascochyta lentis TaxID=205686 RepID=A0A8H7IUZ6_9PLEO|nr:hypothetical protein EKO04_011467 [Ascochyta lentis]